MDWPCPQNGAICHPHILVAMQWTPPRKRLIGRAKETWRRTVEKEMRAKSVTWGELTKKAKDRQQWRALVLAQGHEED